MHPKKLEEGKMLLADVCTRILCQKQLANYFTAIEIRQASKWFTVGSLSRGRKTKHWSAVGLAFGAEFSGSTALVSIVMVG